MPNSKTEIHLVCQVNIRYLEYAILCISSLISRGYDGQLIYIWVDKTLETTFLFRHILLKMPINVRVFERDKSNDQIYQIIKLQNSDNNILRMDVDSMVCGNFNLEQYIESSDETRIGVIYQRKPEVEKILALRMRLFRTEESYKKILGHCDISAQELSIWAERLDIWRLCILAEFGN